eukprot:TRINITY_DN61447_c0_g1_i1.p1 TRINITY_DN61447_c0_g1~~TRINITY_DN61447_c0_g1_i1.p1  ORF type:complete len:283 (+),score=78.07 TRINITY_DN61447_c0_g1_i1:93-851(+)
MSANACWESAFPPPCRRRPTGTQRLPVAAADDVFAAAADMRAAQRLGYCTFRFQPDTGSWKSIPVQAAVAAASGSVVPARHGRVRTAADGSHLTSLLTVSAKGPWRSPPVELFTALPPNDCRYCLVALPWFGGALIEPEQRTGFCGQNPVVLVRWIPTGAPAKLRALYETAADSLTRLLAADISGVVGASTRDQVTPERMLGAVRTMRREAVHFVVRDALPQLTRRADPAQEAAEGGLCDLVSSMREHLEWA